MNHTPLRVCMLGPFMTEAVSNLFGKDQATLLSRLPGMGASAVVALTQARLSAGLPTGVITLDTQTRTTQEFECKDLHYTVCSRRIRKAMRSLYSLERRAIVSAIKRSNADVFHAHWTREYGMAAIDARVPAVITIHDNAASILKWLGPIYLPDYLLAHYAYRRCKHFTAVSPYVAKYVERFTRTSVSVIPNCFPPDILREHSPYDDGARFTVASALDTPRYKNVKNALRTFRVVKDQIPDAEYLLAGNGLEEGGRHHTWARRNGLCRGVEFLGRLSHTTMMDIFRTATVVFHPSLEESFGLVLIEGMALDRPVVAARQAEGSRWVLAEGNAGILVDGQSPFDMAEALVSLHKDRSFARETAGHGNMYTRDRYAPDTVLAQYENVYADVVRNSLDR